MRPDLAIRLDRAARVPLANQIHGAIAAAIREGRLEPGARLPSWRDLAARLGVARGTVRVAYERLVDDQLAAAAGPAGTHVAPRLPASPPPEAPDAPPLPDMHHAFSAVPLAFQMGVPAQDAFPFKLWSRLMARSAREEAAGPVAYPDPRGWPALRREIAAALAIGRGLACTPAQVIVTGGYSGALGLVVQALGLPGARAWMEEPGYPLTRTALHLAGVTPVPVPVDGEGLDVARGVALAPGAALAVVTPGQQAPLGVTLSPARRAALLAWAERSGAWIIEDDYLSELQLRGRPAPALAALDRAGRVLHAGSFSKTISPALRLGFLVVPPGLAARVGEAAACLAPAPSAAVQRAVAAFLAEGHALRHLRRAKRLYAARRDALAAALRGAFAGAAEVEATAGLSVLLRLPPGTPDRAVARAALPLGMAPVPLSAWYADAPRPGLLLGVANLSVERLPEACGRLADLVRRFPA
ncbi:HTH-type transcriptional regulatory protein GabR [Methylobacterium crusticola]|uniref:8-amino-7-oxononanoate synthase n=1 Tax=Methylobacterium crusticola TaxID=1697972 RepID=A0ABQ4QYI5_9HYPH|nr:PLP-dependent aminotransferase family protein [Methylobacterium crusticola]GJD49989.1 HTH-type transcriptional regulatory protein GabR [Methylobacterium crusticola]